MSSSGPGDVVVFKDIDFPPSVPETAYIDVDFVVPDKTQGVALASFLGDLLEHIQKLTAIDGWDRSWPPIDLPEFKHRSKLFVFIGPARSGKSYLLDRMKEALGEFMVDHSNYWTYSALSSRLARLVVWTVSPIGPETDLSMMKKWLDRGLNVVYVTNEDPTRLKAAISWELPTFRDAVTFIRFGYDVPLHINEIKKRAFDGMALKMLPDLAKIVVRY